MKPQRKRHLQPGGQQIVGCYRDQTCNIHGIRISNTLRQQSLYDRLRGAAIQSDVQRILICQAKA